jgi:drug/metabolite transporter (DMT)-like permease
MSLPFTATQCFFAAIIVFALIGLQRGWRREVVSLAFILVGLLFLLTFNLGQGIAHFIFVRAPVLIADIFGQPVGKLNNEPSAQIVQLTTLITFVVILVLGYLIGNKVMPKAVTPADRILGVIPAVISGFAVVFFINSYFSRTQNGSSLFTLAVETPNPSQYIVVIFVIAVVAVIIGLVAASVKKSGGAKK